MIHYLLLKFEPEFFNDEVFSLAVNTFAKLRSVLPGIKDIQVCKNCGYRNCNADIMVRMELATPEDLNVYLEHPLHQCFVEQVNSHVVQRTTFDQA